MLLTGDEEFKKAKKTLDDAWDFYNNALTYELDEAQEKIKLANMTWELLLKNKKLEARCNIEGKNNKVRSARSMRHIIDNILGKCFKIRTDG